MEARSKCNQQREKREEEEKRLEKSHEPKKRVGKFKGGRDGRAGHKKNVASSKGGRGGSSLVENGSIDLGA